ncbi:MAG TPA: Wzz/FepE/Etk N-terminal domain-containing protein [Natronosporangium sp.]
MDFWDLVKVLWRRWYVTAPMLLLTAIAAGYIATTVGPEYQATGYVTVVPPGVQRQVEAGQITRVNPWNEEALADAARIRLEGKPLHDQLAASGTTAEWAVEITGRQPVLAIEVVAETPAEALETMHLLQGVVEEEVQARQAELDVEPGELFTTVRYDQGESVETTASKLRRALVAVLGAGLIATTGTVVALDAILRWRQNRLNPAGASQPPATAASPPRRRYTFAPIPPVHTTGNGGGARSSVIPAFPVRIQRPPITPAPAGSADPDDPPKDRPVNDGFAVAEHRSGNDGFDASDHRPANDGFAVPEDSTIVLPLAKFPWAGRPNDDGADGDQPHRPGAEANQP